MLKNADNLIWVEHRDRELGYAKLLARLLAESGLGSTNILSLPFHLPAGALLAPRKVFVPFLRDSADESLAILRQPPLQVINLNYEQLLGYFNREAKRPRLRGALQLYWYDAFSEILDHWDIPVTERVHIPPPESQLVTCRAREEGWHRTRDGQLHDRIIFIPENFAWAFASSNTLKKKANAGFRIEQIERLRDYSRESLRSFALELMNCCISNPRVAFVLRPHPSITIEAYESELRRYGKLPSNLIVSKKGSAWDWLGGSDAVISGWSTVAYSAYQLGIPAALHHPLPLISELDVPWVRAMPNFKYFRDAVESLLLQKPDTAGVETHEFNFQDFISRIQEDVIPLCLDRDNGRSALFVRSCIVSCLRHLGRIWRPASIRVLNVYHADYFTPIHVPAIVKPASA